MKKYYIVAGIILGLLLTSNIVSKAFELISSPSDFGVLFGVVILIGTALVWVWLVKKILKSNVCAGVKKIDGHNLVILALVIGSSLLGSGCTRIDPGYRGIKVNMYGDDRGVQDLTLLTGMVWFNPFTTSVFGYPTFVQTAVWTKDTTEGSSKNEEISFNSKEGMVITGDMSLSYQLEENLIPTFYVKFRSDNLDTFTHGFLRNVARDAFNEIGPTYPLEQIYGEKKEEFLTKVRAKVNDQVNSFGVHLEQFGFIGAPRLPDPVVDALNAKITATQKAIQVENELRTAEAEAKKAVAKAQGEAQANQVLTASITPALLEWRRLQIAQNAIEKWNGSLPQYNGGGTIPFIQLPAMGQVP